MNAQRIRGTVMRAAMLGLCLALSFTGSASAEPPADAVPPATYFLIDASGSMETPSEDGTIPRIQADEILSRELDKLKNSDKSAKASINFFRATTVKECDLPRSIKAQLPLSTTPPRSPEPGAGFTNLGAVLNATIDSIGDREARIVIITDGGQSSDCGFHVCTVAGERLPGKANIKVDQMWVPESGGDTPPFPCVEIASHPKIKEPTLELGEAVAGAVDETLPANKGTNEPATTDVKADRAKITFLNSLPWAGLATLFAASFIMLGSSFSNAHRELDKKFRTVQTDAEKNDYVDFEKQKPRSRYAALVFIFASALSLAVLWMPGEWAAFARTGADIALNNEFGAAVFLASLMTLGVFAGSQYWRYTELRRSYSVATNEAERIKQAKEAEAERLRQAKLAEIERIRQAKLEDAERAKKAKAEQDALRLAEDYESNRTNFMMRDYRLERYLEDGELKPENMQMLDRISDILKFLAAGPMLTRDQITSAEVDRLGRFTSIWNARTPQGLLNTIPDNNMSKPMRQLLLNEFFYPRSQKNSAEQNPILKHILNELEQLLTPQDEAQ